MHEIADSPSARDDESVPQGTRGTIEDIDSCGFDGDGNAGLIIVAFEGDRVLVCGPTEIAPA